MPAVPPAGSKLLGGTTPKGQAPTDGPRARASNRSPERARTGPRATASNGPRTRAADGAQARAADGPPERASTGPGGWARPLPEATVRRLPVYLQVLAETLDDRQPTISSEGLAARAGVNAAQVRKDFSYMGSYGTRGVGYDVELLVHRINQQLGLDEVHNVVLAGVGHLGQALANYRGFEERGFHIVAAFDTDPGKVGHRVGGVVVYPVTQLERVVRDLAATMAMVATPAATAQEVTDRLVAAGVTSVLNFAPAVLSVPPQVSLRKVDLAVELQILGYYQHLHANAAPL